MKESTIRLLIITANYSRVLSYYDDWLDAFNDSHLFKVTEFDICKKIPAIKLKHLLLENDAVVMLHSTNADTTTYLTPYLHILSERKIPLLTFVGNEVNIPGSPIREKRDAFKIIKPDFISTQLLLESGEYLFGDIATKKVVAIPHALNKKRFKSLIPYEKRQFDIGSINTKYIAHLGDNDRNDIIEFFTKNTIKFNLKTSINNNRLDRDGWCSFLNQSKATVSTEAGGWFLERDDKTVEAIRNYILSKKTKNIVIKNDSHLRSLGHLIPHGVKQFLREKVMKKFLRHESQVNEEIDFYEIYNLFFKDKPKPVHHGKCISSRHFDAIGTKTAQIMFEGQFNGILHANRHYIALKTDFSNIDEVLRQIRDDDMVKKQVNDTYDYVLDNHTYAHRAKQVAAILSSL